MLNVWKGVEMGNWDMVSEQFSLVGVVFSFVVDFIGCFVIMLVSLDVSFGDGGLGCIN